MQATGPTKKARGVVDCRKAADADFYFTAWMDNKPVHMLSKWAPHYISVKRNSKNAQGQYYQQIDLQMPTVIAAYNASMGRTDKFDQLGSYYDDRSRTVTWQSRVFTHFLRASCINALILYNANAPKTLTLLAFFQAVISEWVVVDVPEEDEDVGDE
eukprot:gene41927-51182_t